MSTVFAAHGVHYSYDGVAALNGVDLAIERGSRIALLGANGSGKSTFLRLLDALDFPQQGSILFDGRALETGAFDDEEFSFAFRCRVGLVFQNPDAQLFNPTVRDELAFGPLQLRWTSARTRDAIGEVVETMGLQKLIERPPHRLSMGEKKRVAIASVLILAPEVMLLDEPTAALDPKSQSAVIDLLASWSNAGRTTITATHDLGIVGDIADRVVIFESGRIAATGTPHEVLADADLLRRCGLLHAHRHVHASGLVHSHPHLHRPVDHEH